MNLIVHVRNVNYERLAVLVEHALYGKRAEVLCIVLSNLLTVHRESLLEIAVTIEEADATHVDVRVRSLLHVVTGEHTETARINLNHLVDTVLHAEVGNRGTSCVRLNVHIVAEQLVY